MKAVLLSGTQFWQVLFCSPVFSNKLLSCSKHKTSQLKTIVWAASKLAAPCNSSRILGNSGIDMHKQFRMLGVSWAIKVSSLTQELHVVFQYPRHYNKLNHQFANLGKVSKFFKVSYECSQAYLYSGPLMWVTAGWPLWDQVEAEEKDSTILRQIRDIIRGSGLICYDQLPTPSSKQPAMNKWIDISNQDGSYPRNRCVDSNPWLLPSTGWLLIQTNFLLSFKTDL